MLIGSLETMDKWNYLRSGNVNSMKVEVMAITYMSNTVLVLFFQINRYIIAFVYVKRMSNINTL